MNAKLFRAAGFPMLLAAVLVASAATPTSRTTLQGSIPPWANDRNLIGSADPNGDVGFRVYLGWTDPTGAEALARAVSDPTSSSYGKYMTPAKFRSRFAPAASDVAKVQNWLRSQGFDVQYAPANNHYISAEGTIAQAQNAFGVQFGSYAVRGQSVRSPTANVSIPGSLASIVKGIVGLDDSSQFVQTHLKVDKNA
ncbi:MAG TPA: protease pro-enzyme activation domain-containing protein, partial [Isosphaeraceae bacterium]|nr:protease pro-enzyme activation domain-containing protein [Isosphaeraceae bacterium]